MMERTNEQGLVDLFKESNMKMQSSMIYKALRGDGMRVRPLAKTRSSLGKSQASPTKSESHPGSYMPERGRVAAIKNMFEMKVASKNDSSKIPAKDATCMMENQPAKPLNQSERSTSPTKKPSGIRRRERTPVSESSTQRVPFRSTTLERPVSRASLREDDSENKLKTIKRTIDTRALQKKSVPLFEVLAKGQCGAANGEKSAKIPAKNAVQARLMNKKRVLKRKRLGVTRRATVVAGKPVLMRNEPLALLRKEEAKKAEAGAKGLESGTPGTALRARRKPRVTTTPSMELSRVPSLPKTPASKKTTRNTIERDVVPKTRVVPSVLPLKKQLWMPTETRDSYNQFCPDTKAKRTAIGRKRPQMKKNTNTDNEADGHERRCGTAHTLAKSKFDNTSEEKSSETDEEEIRLMDEMRERKELKRKSMEFFKQFRYGEILRKSMPEIRYTSEILVKSEAEVKRRMTEMDVRMRLSRLDESVSKITLLVPKWTSLLLATRDARKIENIQGTLTNAEKIMNGKVEKARKMLEQYLVLIKNDTHSPPTEEMETIETHTELVQLDMDSLERIFESYERQLQQELEEPTSISL